MASNSKPAFDVYIVEDRGDDQDAFLDGDQVGKLGWGFDNRSLNLFFLDFNLNRLTFHNLLFDRDRPCWFISHKWFNDRLGITPLTMPDRVRKFSLTMFCHAWTRLFTWLNKGLVFNGGTGEEETEAEAA